jgi:hypothetical protein
MISANVEPDATRRRAANAAFENAVVLISRGALEKRTGRIGAYLVPQSRLAMFSAGFARLNNPP